MEYDNSQTLEKLGELLKIPDLCGEDWDSMYADGQRVKEFCDVYESEPLSDPEKFALMELLVASYDQCLWELQHAEPELSLAYLTCLRKILSYIYIRLSIGAL